jgi:hypothetical protein
MVRYLKYGKDEIAEPCIELDDGTVIEVGEILKRLIDNRVINPDVIRTAEFTQLSTEAEAHAPTQRKSLRQKIKDAFSSLYHKIRP